MWHIDLYMNATFAHKYHNSHSQLTGHAFICIQQAQVYIYIYF